MTSSRRIAAWRSARFGPSCDRPAVARTTRSGCAAFTLVEVLVAMAILGVLIVALYAAIASSLGLVRMCNENQRATQILSDRVDTIRLYNWQQMTNGFVITNFTFVVEPLNTNSTPYYTGSVSIVQAPITESYKSNLLEVTARVDWVSGTRPQSRTMTTYVAKYGLQSYMLR